MKAVEREDRLDATRRLSTSGMSRTQSEAVANTIAAAVAPLATSAELKDGLEAQTNALKDGLDAQAKALKDGLEAQTKALEELEKRMATKAEVEAVKTSVERLKVWWLGGLLAAVASIVTLT